MIIKLIQPRMTMRPMDSGLKIRMAPSLGLLTIANMLEKEHTVILENENIEEIDYDRPVDLVGITVTVDVMSRAARIASVYRKRGVPVAAGGIHVTACPEQAGEYFDVVCVGMAEFTWPAMLRDFQNGCMKSVYRCEGRADGSRIVAPGYHLFDTKQYLYCNVISTSRGCPFHCDFCYNSAGACRGLYVNRPIRQVIGDIRAIGKRHVMFIDDNFIGNPRWTLEFVRAIRPMKLRWNAAVSADIGEMPELLDEMALSGCESLFIGFESLNAGSIRNVHKGQNHVDRFESLAAALHDRGIMINASFVFGLDGDDPSTFRTTLDWIVKNRIETVTSHILTPYPGTKVYDDFVEAGRITDHDFSRYNTAHVVFEPANMTAEELYDGYIWIYKQIYSFKNIFRRLPKARKQWIPYLLFNFGYRKFGKFTERLCGLITYERVGRIAEKLSYRL